MVPPPLLDLSQGAAGADVDPLSLIVEVAAFVNEIVVGTGESDSGPLSVIREGIRRLGPWDAGRCLVTRSSARFAVCRYDLGDHLRHPLQGGAILQVVSQELVLEFLSVAPLPPPPPHQAEYSRGVLLRPREAEGG